MEPTQTPEQQACQNHPLAMALAECEEIMVEECTEMKYLQMNYSTCSSVVVGLAGVVLMQVSLYSRIFLISGPFGPGFTAQFGGPGIRVRRFGGAPRPRRQEAPQQQGNSSVLYQLLPVLLLLAITIIPALFSPSTPSTPSPSFVFETAKPPYTLERSTPQHGISYFLNPSEVQSLSNAKLRQLDQKAEVTFVRGLRDQCQLEHDLRLQKMANAQGWFGQIKDQNAYDEARTMKLNNCERLRAIGYRPEIY